MRFSLPLILLAVMVAIAVGLELALYGRILLLTKLPLAALLAWAFARRAPLDPPAPRSAR